MRLILIFIILFKNALAYDLFEIVDKNNFEIVEQFDSSSNINATLSKLTNEESKIALIYLNATSNTPSKLKFTHLAKLYLFHPQIPKRDILEKKIKDYVKNYEIINFASQVDEIEEMIWFFILTENPNLFAYLRQNNLTPQNFISIVKSRSDFNILKNIIYSKTNEASNLLWEGKIQEALPIISSLEDGEEKRILLARVFFQTRQEKYRIYAKSLIDKGNFSNDGFVYDYIKYLQKTSHYNDVLHLIHESKINPANPNFGKFWIIIEALFRKHIDDKEYHEAYRLISEIKFNKETQVSFFIRAEFLAGFVALKFLKDYKAALRHFEELYELKSGTVFTKSRGAFFLSRTYAALGRRDLERRWLMIASKYINTFYGILALDKLNFIDPVLLLGLEKFNSDQINENLAKRSELHKFYFDDLLSRYYMKDLKQDEVAMQNLKNNVNFKIGITMLLLNKIQDANAFFTISIAEKTETEAKLAFNILSEYLSSKNLPNTNSILNTFSSKAANYGTVIVESYPLLDFIIEKENITQNSLVHAIIKQESNFVLKAISGPGAIGLMQVIPSTGKIVSKSINVDFNLNRLKNDYKYNIQIGSYYIDLLLKRFNQSYPFALIGYNAGPNRVGSWQKRFFEPKTFDEMIDFIELIPFKETREYVLRVMENEVIYNYLISYHLQNSTLPVQKKDSAFNKHLQENFKKNQPATKQKPSTIKSKK